MAGFQGADFYRLDDILTEEERMVRDTVRAFVEDEIIPIIETCYRDGVFPRDLIPKLAGLDMLGANLEGYDCPGLGSVAYGLIMQELERGDSGIRSFASVQGALVMYPIHTFGSEEQKKHWLPKMARGEAIGCFGLTEHDFGSDPGGMLTRATLKGDRYILNGAKMWITNGGMADVAVVFAKDDEGIVRGFLVERGTKGFSTRDIEGKYSLRASVTSELVFQDCEIPRDNLLPETNGLKCALMCLNQARYGIAWGALGSAMACYDSALRYAKIRIQFGKPIAQFQLQQRKLTRMITEITKGQLLAWRLGKLKDEGRADHAQISMAKYNNVGMALHIAREARSILGANGITDEYPVLRHAMNLESVITYEGTEDIHKLIVGERITGLSAFE